MLVEFMVLFRVDTGFHPSKQLPQIWQPPQSLAGAGQPSPFGSDQGRCNRQPGQRRPEYPFTLEPKHHSLPQYFFLDPSHSAGAAALKRSIPPRNAAITKPR